MGLARKTPEQRVREINQLLSTFITDNGESLNNEIIKKLRLDQSHFYTMKKKLIALGRVNSANIVQSTKPVVEKDLRKLGDIYKKKAAKKKVVKKKVAKKRVAETLPAPIEVPIMEHPTGATITINIPVKELVECFLTMLRTGGVK